ncbi:hypothetical protein DL767_004080 [Monosporascus sp. MG133]|nr:hypothetical protein DL767_004080 [Monosporascus sp. MG133]
MSRENAGVPSGGTGSKPLRRSTADVQKALFGDADNLRRISPEVLAASRNTELEAYKGDRRLPDEGGRGPAGPSSSCTISDSEPEPTVLELELQRENEALREQLEQLRLSNKQEMARRELIPNSQPARAAEVLEKQKAELAGRNAELVAQDAELRRLLETASDEKAALETEVERLRQQSADSAATACEDFEKRYQQAQQDLHAYDVRLRRGIEHNREIADHVPKVRELRAAWLQEADGHTETKKQLREAKEKLSEAKAQLTEATAQLDESLKREETLVVEAKKANADHTQAVVALEGSLSGLRDEVAEKKEEVDRLQEANRQLEESSGRLEAKAHALTEELREEPAKIQVLEAKLVIEKHNVTSRDPSLAPTQAEHRESTKVQALEAGLAIERHSVSSRDRELASLKGELTSECESANVLRGAGSLLRTGISAFLTRAFGSGPPAGWASVLQDISRDAPAIRGGAAAAGPGSDQIWVFETPWRAATDPGATVRPTAGGQMMQLALFGEDPEGPVVLDLHRGFRARGADLLAHLDEAVCAVDRRDQGAVAGRLARSCGDGLCVIGDFALLVEVGAGEFMLLDLKRRTIRTIEKCLAGVVDDFTYMGLVNSRSGRPGPRNGGRSSSRTPTGGSRHGGAWPSSGLFGTGASPTPLNSAERKMRGLTGVVEVKEMKNEASV